MITLKETGGIGDLMRRDMRVIEFVDKCIEWDKKTKKEVFGLTGREFYLANKEAEIDSWKIAKENAEIDEDNRRLDHDNYN